MNHLTSATFCVALVAVLLSFAQAKDLYHLCGQFDNELRKAVGESVDPETNFNEAIKLLARESPLDSRMRSFLAQGWKAVHDSTGCDASVDALVAQLYECRPLERERLRVTLGAAITNYVTRCSTTDGHWSDRVSDVETKALSRSKSTARDFIDSKFIAHFSVENKLASQIPFYPQDLASLGCCEPKRAGYAAYMNLLAEYQNNYKGSGREYFYKKPDALGRYVQKWIVGPCLKYVKALAPVITEAEAIAQFYPDGYKAFVDNQGGAFKSALFRFNFCKKLAMPEKADELVESIKLTQRKEENNLAFETADLPIIDLSNECPKLQGGIQDIIPLEFDDTTLIWQFNQPAADKNTELINISEDFNITRHKRKADDICERT